MQEEVQVNACYLKKSAGGSPSARGVFTRFASSASTMRSKTGSVPGGGGPPGRKGDSSLQRARMRAEMQMEKLARARREEAAGKEGRRLGPDDAGDDFFKLLQDAKDLLPDNSWWVGEEYPAITS